MFEKVLAAMLLVLQFAAAQVDPPTPTPTPTPTSNTDVGPMGIYSANQKIG